MRRIRVYDPSELVAGQRVALNPDASHHLLHVLRKKVGDTLWVFNNSGAEFRAEILEVEKKRAVLLIGESQFPLVESSLHLHLGQAISRGDRMDYAIQKAVELGAAEITPLFTEFCQVKLSKERFQKKVAHWQSIAISAAEQSGRCKVPTVHAPEKLNDWMMKDTADIKYVCCPRVAHQEEQDVSGLAPKSISVVIGPEGGFSDSEVQFARDNHFDTLSLGPRVLRTETAAVVALTLLQTRWGDL